MRATFTAFGMTKRAGRSVSNDAGLQHLAQGQGRRPPASWPSPGTITCAWRWAAATRRISSRSARRVEAARAAGKEVLIDCEHFFDGYKANPAYALACAAEAYKAGARWVVLCDTNGGTLPGEVAEIVRAVTKSVPGSHLGIHAHNDTDQAVANSLAAVDAGVRQIQGTLNGIGERCGNANLVSIIPTLVLKPHYRDALRNRRRRCAARRPHPCLARPSTSCSTARPTAGALCGQERLRHQGGHPCLGHR